jgi:hypothetical protein
MESSENNVQHECSKAPNHVWAKAGWVGVDWLGVFLGGLAETDAGAH